MSSIDEAILVGEIKDLIDKKQYDKAYSLYETALKISQNDLNSKMADICLSGMAKCLGGKAMSLMENGKFEKAVETWQKIEKITRDINDKKGLELALDCLRSCTGKLYKKYEEDKNYIKAVNCLSERERVCRELGDKNELWKSLYEQAYLLVNKLNDHKKAKPKCEEAIEILPDTTDGPNFIMGAAQMLMQIEAKLIQR
jgi:tetratricopeptide (TPR) repeat protein